MRIIFKITRTELQNLFYSPVAWFLAIIFLIQCAYFYMQQLLPGVHMQDWMIENNPGFTAFDDNQSITSAIFSNGDNIIPNVYTNLYLFIPLLTMGVISREINNGTIKLLYSSPIKLRQIVLGKYLAVMCFILVLLSILGLFMVLGAFHIQSVDYGLFLSALLGFLLLAGAYSAIGLFMSSLTTYQIVSGISTFMLLFILVRIGTLWQQYDFVRDLTWFLSLSGRTQQMLAGLITTRDVIYFIVIIFMFLSFTLIKLRGQKESKPWTTKAARYAGVMVISLMLGYITSRPLLVGYLDATAENVNTIAPEAQQILKQMGKEPLEITLYGNLFGGNLDAGLPEARNPYLYGFWDKYLRFKPDIKFRYVYYYDNDKLKSTYPDKTLKQISGIIAEYRRLDSSKFIPPAEIRKQMDPYSEELNLFMTAKYKGDTVNLRTYTDQTIWPFQREVASKFKRLIEKNAPKVYFLTGNLERNIYKKGEREYFAYTTAKDNRGSLVNRAFDVDTLSLEKQDIPAGATALVLADPKTELRTATRKKLKRYIADGGNLLILGEPRKQDVLNPVLQDLGVQQMKGQLVQVSSNETPDKITPYTTTAGVDIIQQDSIGKQRALQIKYPKSLMAGAAALTYNSSGAFSISPIQRTLPDEQAKVPVKINPAGLALTAAQKSARVPVNRRTWLKMGRLVADSVAPVFSPQDGDIKEFSFVTAISLTRQVKNKQQRVIVMGDADVLSNSRFDDSAFKNDLYNWFNYGEYPVFISRAYHKDILFMLTEPTAKMLKTFFLWVLPGLLLLAGAVLLIRRRRK